MTKILLVEDNEMNRDMLTRRLERKGYDLVWAGDGRLAVEMASSESPDVILMDKSLPELDGWDATRLIKQSEATANLPIIGLTAHGMTGDREAALDAGCDEYETKPLQFVQLIDKINTLVDQAK